jgi:cellulose biosynthesis protein BcsQ
VTVITLASAKGGVGKTTAAVTFAHLAAGSGRRVLIWDLDPQAAATHVLRVARRAPGGARHLLRRRRAIEAAIVPSTLEGVDIVPADFSLRYLDVELERIGRPRRRIRRALQVVAPRYDDIIQDCPPGIGLTVESALRATDALVVPIVPTDLPMRGYELLSAYVAAERRLRGTQVFGFVSMLDRRKQDQCRLADELTDARDGILRPAVPLSVAAERMVTARAPVTVTEPRSPAAVAYRGVWSDLDARLGR